MSMLNVNVPRRSNNASDSQTITGLIATPNGFVDGVLTITEGRVAAIDGNAVAESDVRSHATAAKPIVLPGFVDLHVHGGGGADVMDGGDAATKIAAIHAAHGTTSLLATTLTAPPEDFLPAFRDLQAISERRATSAILGSRILGVHLEGPYINENKLGAQPAYSRVFDFEEVKRLHAVFPIKLITLAPEIEGGIDAVKTLTSAGFVVQIGHTTGSYEAGVDALNAGAKGFTHLFNAMSGMHHRAPGIVGAALAHARYAEIIPDMQHVHAGAIRVALRSIECLYCVTDSTSAAGMPDGQYRLGRHTVTKCRGGVRLPDGTLAGSTLTMDEALRNLVDELQLPLLNASRRTSTYAADFLNMKDRGRLEIGAWADIVVLSRDLKIEHVWVEGRRL
jgi:N-acetylglucosamine-6-phosphate deacetylase